MAGSVPSTGPEVRTHGKIVKGPERSACASPDRPFLENGKPCFLQASTRQLADDQRTRLLIADRDQPRSSAPEHGRPSLIGVHLALPAGRPAVGLDVVAARRRAEPTDRRRGAWMELAVVRCHLEGAQYGPTPVKKVHRQKVVATRCLGTTALGDPRNRIVRALPRGDALDDAGGAAIRASPANSLALWLIQPVERCATALRNTPGLSPSPIAYVRSSLMWIMFHSDSSSI